MSATNRSAPVQDDDAAPVDGNTTTHKRLRSAAAPQQTGTVAFETLGCKLNQYETDSIATTLRSRGYTIVPFEDAADAYVINSCTVTNKADRKSRNSVYRARRTGGERAVVILTGCFADGGRARNRRDRIADPADGATYVVDNAHKNSVPDLIDAHFRGEIPDVDALPADTFGFATPEQIFHTRTNIKIQDGCDNFCTFCIIPFVRGGATSRPTPDILREAREAIAGGSRELVLTGVNMSRYRDEAGRDFPTLVAGILDLAGKFRLRISSLEPDGLDDRFVQLFHHEKMAPNLHLCAQSGSDRVLLHMRRMYTIAQFRDVVTKLRAVDARFNVTTDMIVGFPGESEGDHRATLDLIDEIGFGHVHTFPFSVRTGTRAERMGDRVDGAVIRRRATAVRDAAEKQKRRYRSTLIGSLERVLVERVDPDGIARGFGDHYVPVRFPADTTVTRNKYYDVEITGIDPGNDPDLIGRRAG